MTALAPYHLTPIVTTGQSLQPPYSISRHDALTWRKPPVGDSLRYEAGFGNLLDVAALSRRIVQDTLRALDEGARCLATAAGTASLMLAWPIPTPITEGNELHKTIVDITTMLSWGSADPTYSDPVPDPKAIAHSVAWVAGLYLDITGAGQHWMKPSVTLDDHGDVVLEWWRGDKSLAIFISSSGAEFLQASGTDIDTDMRDGDAEPSETRQQLWAWLLS